MEVRARHWVLAGLAAGLAHAGLLFAPVPQATRAVPPAAVEGPPILIALAPAGGGGSPGSGGAARPGVSEPPGVSEASGGAAGEAAAAPDGPAEPPPRPLPTARAETATATPPRPTSRPIRSRPRAATPGRPGAEPRAKTRPASWAPAPAPHGGRPPRPEPDAAPPPVPCGERPRRPESDATPIRRAALPPAARGERPQAAMPADPLSRPRAAREPPAVASASHGPSGRPPAGTVRDHGASGAVGSANTRGGAAGGKSAGGSGPAGPGTAGQGSGKATAAAGSNAGGTGKAAYTRSLGAWLARHKRYPAEARSTGQQGTVRVTFSIDRNGRVVSRGVSAGSGHPVLDREALAMIDRASPMPRPPADLGGGRMTVTVPISFTLR